MRPKLAANHAYAAAVPHSQEALENIAKAARAAKDEIKPLETVIVASVDMHRILQRVNQHRNAAAVSFCLMQKMSAACSHFPTDCQLMNNETKHRLTLERASSSSSHQIEVFLPLFLCTGGCFNAPFERFSE
jgi:hypothetical protein